MKHVLVTGASSGIGHAVVKRLLASGDGVFGSVRNEADAQRTREQFGERFTPLVFDVCDAAAIDAAARLVRERLRGAGLAALVNNAGIAVSGPLMHLPIESVRHQLDVNVLGVLRVTQAFLPLLGAQRPAAIPPGRIINISSVSGRIAAPFVGAYAASKHGLEALTHAFRRELLIYGIDAISVQPGVVRTPIWSKAVAPVKAFPGTDYEPLLEHASDSIAELEANGIAPDEVARVVQRALNARRPKTRYLVAADSLQYRLLFHAVPDRMMDWFIGRAFKKILGPP